MQRMVRRLGWLARAAAVVVALVGLTALVGWAFDRDGLRAVFVQPPVTVKTNTALALVAGGASLWLLAVPKRSRARTAGGRVLAGLVLALGALTLSQHLGGWDLGIDQFLFRESPGALATASPNRMGPPAAVCLTLVGVGLLLLDAPGGRATVREVAAVAVVMVSLLGVIGYATQASPLYAFARVTGIALVTALALFLLGGGILAARPDHGLMRLLCLSDEAGSLARRLVGPAFLMPLGAAFALTRAADAGWFDDRFAVAIMALTVTVSLTAILWKTAADLSRALRARNAAESVRARREEALRAANRRQTEFLAVLSHELRNPLAPLRYALEMIRDPGEDVAGPKHVAERQLAHLVRLVDDLLDVSRVATGKIQLRRAPVDVRRALMDAADATRPAVEAGRHQLAIDPPAEPLWVEADPDRLSQVLTNLINNAARYTPPGGRIRVGAAPDGEMALIRVADTGVGLEPHELEHVFDMFNQLGGSGEGGLGIGLALVKAITEMHGGRVEARSDGPSKGSEFRVWFPRVEAPVVAAPAPTAAAPLAGRRRILVADDNQDSAEMMRVLLELDGHVVQVATDGAAAFSLMTAFAPEVAVLDIGMPGMDGYEVARRVRAEGRPVYLIAVTGWGQESDRRRARDAGFDAHITKPANPEEIRRMVAARQAGSDLIP